MAESENRIPLEVWVAVNEKGDYEVGTTEEQAATRSTENQDGCHCRIVKLVVLVTPPATTEVAIEVPDDIGHVVDISTPRPTDLSTWPGVELPAPRLFNGR